MEGIKELNVILHFILSVTIFVATHFIINFNLFYRSYQ